MMSYWKEQIWASGDGGRCLSRCAVNKDLWHIVPLFCSHCPLKSKICLKILQVWTISAELLLFSSSPWGHREFWELRHIAMPINSMTHFCSPTALHRSTAVIKAPSWWVLLAHVFTILISFQFNSCYITEGGGFLRVPAWACDIVFVRLLGNVVITTWIQWKGLWSEYVSLALMRLLCICICDLHMHDDVWRYIGLRLFKGREAASQPRASFCPNCSPQTPAQLVVFYILIIFPSSLTFQLLYFVILWSPPGGNFCAGYDLTELANHTASLKLEQDVTKGPGLIVSAVRSVCVCVCVCVCVWGI